MVDIEQAEALGSACMAVGPVRLAIDGPARWIPGSDPLDCAELYNPQAPFRLEVPLKIRSVPRHDGFSLELDEASVGSQGDVVRIDWKGVIARCDLAAHRIEIEVCHGHNLIMHTRYFASLMMPAVDCLMLHAAAFVKDGQALLFPGHSEAGKSTISRIAMKAGLQVINDDTVVLGFKDGQPVVWGTPLSGDLFQAALGPFPLGGIFFLNKGPVDTLSPLPRSRLVPQLLASTMPWTTGLDPDLGRRIAQRLMALVLDLCQADPVCYDLHFRPTAQVLQVLP